MAKKINRAQKIFLVVASFVVGLIVLDVLFIGNVQYLAKWSQCGTKPYVTSHPWGVGEGPQPQNTVVTNNPGYLDGKSPVLKGIGEGEVVCTIQDVENIYGKNYTLSE